MIIYIAGPMTGIEGHNWNKFNRIADELRNKGYSVINPAEIQGEYEQAKNLTYMEAMKNAISALLKCDTIYLLESWNTSKGAKLEYKIANTLGYRIFFEGEL